MTVGASLDLQEAIVAKLQASSDLQALIGNPIRLYAHVEPRPTFPYTTLGPSQRLPDLADCINGAEIFADLHAFSRDGGYGEVKRIGAAMIEVLHHADDLTLDENVCVLIELSDERYFIDPDNNTKHGVLTFRALVEPIVP